jgi:CheY-like chemotaxis protein
MDNKMAGKVILVIDNDSAIRDSFEIVLTNEGFNVVCAEDGSEALVKLAECDPSVILLDVMMTPMDGLEFLAQLRERGLQGTYPIIMMTAMFVISEDLLKLQKDGEIAIFLPKPLESLSKFLLLIEDLEQLSKSKKA